MRDLSETYRKISRDYIESQKEFLGLSNLNQEDFAHVCSLAASVMMTRDNYLKGGGFVQAIVDNNLEQAIGRADHIAIKGLKAFVMVKLWCRIDEEVNA